MVLKKQQLHKIEHLQFPKTICSLFVRFKRKKQLSPSYIFVSLLVTTVLVLFINLKEAPFDLSSDTDEHSCSLFINEAKAQRVQYQVVDQNEHSVNESTSSCHRPTDREAFRVPLSQNTETTHSSPAPQHIACVPSEDWVHLTDQGDFLYNNEYLESHQIRCGNGCCQYATISWYQDDYNYALSDFVTIVNGTRLTSDTHEFFYVKCVSLDDQTFQTALAKAVHLEQQASSERSEQKLEPKQSRISSPISVVMIGLDSVSRQDWLRRLPLSSAYYQNKMGGIVLNSYNIMGDGTPAALVPLLTGRHEEELPPTERNNPNAAFVNDVYPFVWMNFSTQLAYKSLFAEDWPHVGTFQYRMKGMSRPITDHYMRPFYLLVDDKDLLNPHTACIGAQTLIRLNLNYLQSVMQKHSAQNVGLFSFMFLNQYSHDGNEHLSWVDNELRSFLMRFHRNKQISQNTFLILFADHGPRFNKERESMRGLLDERNPFMSFYIPSIFKKQYPQMFNNFQANADRLVTPLDVHRTLLDLIDLVTNKRAAASAADVANQQRVYSAAEQLTPTPSQRDVSLFEKIPASRTCSQAGVDAHWCACLKRTELVVNKRLVEMARTFIAYVNQVLLRNVTHLCAPIGLKRVLKAYLLSNQIKSVNKTASVAIQRTNALSWLGKLKEIYANMYDLKAPKVKVDYSEFMFRVETSPNNAIFELTVSDEFDLATGLSRIELNRHSIGRINRYGTQSRCIHDAYPNLRKYCSCI